MTICCSSGLCHDPQKISIFVPPTKEDAVDAFKGISGDMSWLWQSPCSSLHHWGTIHDGWNLFVKIWNLIWSIINNLCLHDKVLYMIKCKCLSTRRRKGKNLFFFCTCKWSLLIKSTLLKQDVQTFSHKFQGEIMCPYNIAEHPLWSISCSNIFWDGIFNYDILQSFSARVKIVTVCTHIPLQ